MEVDPSRPLISVITVVKNDKEGLERTLNSAVKQLYKRLELVVIDGGSVDGTVEVIQKYKNDITYTVSEADKGTYDAMNKGIQNAKGDYVLFLNAGDYFFSPSSLDSFFTVASFEDLIYGDILFVDGNKTVERKYPDILDFYFFTGTTLPHPGTLIRRELFAKYGLYNTSMRITADWAFFLDLVAKHGATYRHVPTMISCFVLGGLSSDSEKVREEKDHYLSTNYAFYYSKYVLLRSYEKRIKAINKSRYLKLISRLLPARLKSLLSD